MNGVSPGDLLVAARPMRAWESFDERGSNGDTIKVGSTVMLMHLFEVGNHVRMLVLHDQVLRFFSSRKGNFSRNWEPIKTWPERLKSDAWLVNQLEEEASVGSLERS